MTCTLTYTMKSAIVSDRHKKRFGIIQRVSKILLLSYLGMAAFAVHGQEGPSLDATQDTNPASTALPAIELKSTIVGNQEQPEVIHIVPWKTVDAPIPAYNPISRFIDRDVGVVDRNELQRQLKIHQALQ